MEGSPRDLLPRRYSLTYIADVNLMGKFNDESHSVCLNEHVPEGATSQEGEGGSTSSARGGVQDCALQEVLDNRPL